MSGVCVHEPSVSVCVDQKDDRAASSESTRVHARNHLFNHCVRETLEIRMRRRTQLAAHSSPERGARGKIGR